MRVDEVFDGSGIAGAYQWPQSSRLNVHRPTPQAKSIKMAVHAQSQSSAKNPHRQHYILSFRLLFKQLLG
jgi:hypothetical protein